MFFPSERNLYKTNAYKNSANFIEDSFSQLEKETEMRYSESLFVKSYFDYLDLLEFADDEFYDDDKKEFYELLCKSLGGIPYYEDGNVTSIHQGETEISQKLFSTKQKIDYFLILCCVLTLQVIQIE